VTRLATTHEHSDVTAAPLVFTLAGLCSGAVCWLVPLPRLAITIGGQHVNLTNQGLVFAAALAAAVFLTGVASRLEQTPATWIAAFVATWGLYLLVLHLLFGGYFSQLFRMPVWLNLGLCGMIGAAMMGLITATVVKTHAGVLHLIMILAGGVSALAAFHPIFLFPWWQTVVAAVIGLWIAQAIED